MHQHKRAIHHTDCCGQQNTSAPCFGTQFIRDTHSLLSQTRTHSLLSASATSVYAPGLEFGASGVVHREQRDTVRSSRRDGRQRRSQVAQEWAVDVL